MKNNGVVRKIDELGRIVIPKEFRKKLKIRDGENIVMSINLNNEIIVDKYSLFKDYLLVIESLVETIKSKIDKTIIITDRDEYIRIYGGLKKELLGKEISKQLLNYIKEKQKVYKFENSSIEFTKSKILQCEYIISPIMYYGEVIGLFIVISEDHPFDKKDVNYIELAVEFLNKYIEK